jgi:hypothetical protein
MLARKFNSQRNQNIKRNQPQLSTRTVISNKLQCCDDIYKPIGSHETNKSHIEHIVYREYKREKDCDYGLDDGGEEIRPCCPTINYYEHPVKSSQRSNKSILYRKACFENDPEKAPNHSCRHY